MSWTPLREIEGLPEEFISRFFPLRFEEHSADRKTLNKSHRSLYPSTGKQCFVTARLGRKGRVCSTYRSNVVTVATKVFKLRIEARKPQIIRGMGEKILDLTDRSS